MPQNGSGRALIVGAGVAGLSLRLALSRALPSLAVTQLELAKDFRGPRVVNGVGTAVVLTRSSLRSLADWRVTVGDCVPIEAARLIVAPNGGGSHELGCIRLPEGGVVCTRSPNLHACLLKAVGGVKQLQMHNTVSGVTECLDKSGRVRVTFARNVAGKQSQNIDIMCAADGPASLVRSLLDKADAEGGLPQGSRPHIRYPGYGQWQYEAEIQDVPADIVDVWSQGRRVTLFPTSCSTVSVVVAESMKKPIEKPRFGEAVVESAWAATEPLAGCLPSGFQFTRESIKPESCSFGYSCDFVSQMNAAANTGISSRVCLLGDALHPSSGAFLEASLAIEDASTLAEMLAGNEDVTQAVRSFLGQRMGRGVPALQKASQMVARMGLQGGWGLISRTATRALIPKAAGKVDWVLG